MIRCRRDPQVKFICNMINENLKLQARIGDAKIIRRRYFGMQSRNSCTKKEIFCFIIVRIVFLKYARNLENSNGNMIM